MTSFSLLVSLFPAAAAVAVVAVLLGAGVAGFGVAVEVEAFCVVGAGCLEAPGVLGAVRLHKNTGIRSWYRLNTAEIDEVQMRVDSAAEVDTHLEKPAGTHCYHYTKQVILGQEATPARINVAVVNTTARMMAIMESRVVVFIVPPDPTILFDEQTAFGMVSSADLGAMDVGGSERLERMWQLFMMVEAIWIVTWIGTILGATKKPAQLVSIMVLRFPFEVCSHAASLEYAGKITPHEGFIHSIRCYYFALAILSPSRSLHGSSGWTSTAEGTAHPAAATMFELHGGIMAYEHLQAVAPELTAQQVGDIVQSNVLHTSEWSSGKLSATRTLISLSTLFDVCGYDAQGPGSLDFLIDRKTVQESRRSIRVATLRPRNLIEVVQREFVGKPDCLLSHFHNSTDEFLKLVRKEPLVSADE
ncbi:hypothetical protein DFH08DRAFT_821028 [Mycena albidolilacea]|uniref:Uncharacterized protein n=1 Tax=Mycena albidolilacea TaxID=1033008 RepID=A0AAD6ZBF4_9AGAR|nr:hypothetical protein DFH08DRAFT_821028 [Mycena albidolilacea]